MPIKAKILSINLSRNKGERKKPQSSAILAKGGIVGDAHFDPANSTIREVSILDWSSVKKLYDKKPDAHIQISYGDFAENISTQNLNIKNISVGDTIKIYSPKKNCEEPILLKVTAIGKKCHNDCQIKTIMGDCVMPREGIFASVLKGGQIQPGDIIEIIKK